MIKVKQIEAKETTDNSEPSLQAPASVSWTLMADLIRVR